MREPFVFITVEQIGDGLLLVSGDSNLFDCHDENCDFWTAFTQARIEDLL